MILALYQRRLPTTIFVRQSKTGSVTCKTPGYKKVEEIQSFADQKDMKKFHDALKTIYGPKSSGATPLLSADGSTLLTDKDAILKRWADHFNSVLNRPSSVNDNAINRLPQIDCNVLLDEFPTVTETRKAIQHLSSGKEPGTDAIPTEVYKAGGLPMAEKLTELFQCMHVEKGGYPTSLQRCFHNPPTQTERKSSSLLQPQRYLSLINCWEDTGKNSIESPECIKLLQNDFCK